MWRCSSCKRPRTTPLRRTCLVALAAVLVSAPACKKSAPPPEPLVVARPVAPTAAAQTEDPGVPPGDASLLVQVTWNGKSPPDFLSCSVQVFDEGSSGSPRARGRCGEIFSVARGAGDVEVELGVGVLRTKQRLATQQFESARVDLRVAFLWPLGRLRVGHADSSGVGSCAVQVFLAGASDRAVASGDEATYHYLEPGTYDAKLSCPAGSNQVEFWARGLAVTAGNDTVNTYRLNPAP